ncbi:CPBP family intramembrane glutamic endopeptidase [Agromyces bracchium]|uniref:CPBP family intramembrane metalloprotease n=1 Tax=Agromyces bracchium TaxID=88376 RepID=A0A6I3MDG9_9MICO|nr:type II CAAX endopeptidase family protein [Agromyces bracchium]MTH70212.1 CPBP family intramembrane metalloprotease [Agromyces bracchium]
MSIRTLAFVQDAAAGKRVTRWWLAYLLVLFVGIFVIQAISAAALSRQWPVDEGSAAAQLHEAIGFAALLGAILLWVWLFERRNPKTLGLRRPGRGLVVMLIGIVGGILLQSIPIGFLLLTGNLEPVDGPTGGASGGGAIPLLVLIVVFVTVQAGTEEVATRGFLLQNSAYQLPGWLAVLLPALLFTVVHFAFDPLPFATILLWALFASFVVLRLGSLWLVIGIHTGWNFAMGNLYGISVSGLPAHSNSFTYLAPTPGAPDWLTGGEFGTEAGVPAVLVLALSTLIAFLAFRTAQKQRGRGEGQTETAPARSH